MTSILEQLKWESIKKRGTDNRLILLYKVGMSFGVRFKVRTFGNKHPDGSNVRIFCFRFRSHVY